MMNSSSQIAPFVFDDSQLETEFTCLVECGEWRIRAKFCFHTMARCVQVTATTGDTARCVNLRADCETGEAGFNTAHLLLTDNQLPWAHGLCFQALQHGLPLLTGSAGSCV